MDKLREAAREVVRQHSMECLSDKAIEALREALEHPVKLAISEDAFNWIDANAPMFVREALAGVNMSPTEPTNMNLNCKSVQARLATSWGYVKSEQAEQGLDTCPGCGGIADNGHDREFPPNPYYCTKCSEQAECKECGAKQAQIDRLMLEYCPDEMTPEQMQEWRDNQRPAEQAEQKQVAVLDITYGREPECYATPNAEDLPEGTYRLYAAPVQQAEQEPVCCVADLDVLQRGFILDRGYSLHDALYAAPVEPMKQEPVGEMIDKAGYKGAAWYLEPPATGTKLYAAPVRTKDLTDEIDRLCVAIKAEDDYCVDNGDYMLDSNDCIKIIRGEWARPDYSLERAVIAKFKEKNK